MRTAPCRIRSHCVLLRRMDQPSPALISAAIKAAPAFARLGLSVRDERLRDRAADALASAIAERLEHPPVLADENQMPLPF